MGILLAVSQHLVLSAIDTELCTQVVLYLKRDKVTGHGRRWTSVVCISPKEAVPGMELYDSGAHKVIAFTTQTADQVLVPSGPRWPCG